MFSRQLTFILTSFLLLISLVATTASATSDLYQAKVLVRSTAEQDEGMREGLIRVLQKVSGQEGIADIPGIAEAINTPDMYIVQFGFESTDETTLSSDGVEVSAKQMVMQFDKKAIERLLKDHSISVWQPTERPNTLVWLIQSASGERTQLGESDRQHPLLQALTKEAKQKAMPLMWPLLDLEDAAALDEVDMWGLYADTIRTASQRYNPGAILAARVYAEGEQTYSGRWLLLAEQTQKSKSFSKLSADELAAMGVKLAASFYTSNIQDTADGSDAIDNVEQPKVNTTDVGQIPAATNSDDGSATDNSVASTTTLPVPMATSHDVRLAVDGVEGIDAFADINQLLKNLTEVKAVHLVKVSGAMVVFDIDLKDNRTKEKLVARLNRESKLSILPQQAGGDRFVQYQWVGQ
ncbi:DUF2066 domain-containing protein [Zooshikella ganghwensis]|uniref:DUF2066 domain-containing protein n=1 Tax=Zooshikella ganghwensis TaxID=202772 RepID=A0A4P9VK52_9GAMM|nr:DUF2066 domain-containing protein [Zooshikella ganghwensis]RDH43066.1 DUF2066 domain-containing protein [Zooshikella ganghwensis]